MKQKFLIVDDSELDCYIAQKVIQYSSEDVDINMFKDAKNALEYIVKTSSDNEQSKTIVLLDILMPVMDGYAFMEDFERMRPELKKNYLIIAITSSMYRNQIDRIYTFESIKGVLEKPITMRELNKIILESDPDYPVVN